MASLYELTNDVQKLWDLMEEGILDDEMLIGAMETSQEELNIKLENYCKFIRNLESDIAGLKEEEKRLASKRKTMENTIERTKAAMQQAMTVAGEKKIKGSLFSLTIQNNPPSVVMDVNHIEDVPEEYLIYQDPKVDRKKIAEDIKAGKDLEGLAHLEQNESLRIR